MTFEDLPDDWPTRSITDPEIFDDVVDLVVTDRDRLRGAVYVLLCDRGGRLLQPCAVTADQPGQVQGRGAGDHLGSDPVEMEDDERRAIIEPFARGLAQARPGAGLVVIVARRGFDPPTTSDLGWARAAAAVCHGQRLTLFAAAVSTPFGVRRLPDPVAAR